MQLKYSWLYNTCIPKNLYIESNLLKLFHSLKPENVLIDKQGYIRLIDFGLSCFRS